MHFGSSCAHVCRENVRQESWPLLLCVSKIELDTYIEPCHGGAAVGLTLFGQASERQREDESKARANLGHEIVVIEYQ